LYPAVLVTAGTVAVLIIFVAVVPRFASLLKSSRADIPELSRWVIEAGIFMRDNLSSFAALGAGVTLLVVALLSSPLVRGGIHEVALRTPLLGTWLMKVEVGRWATVLGSLVANRVSLLEAMNLAAAAVSSRKMEKDLNDAAKGLQRGSTLAEQLRGLSWFPPTRVNLIRVGERSGELPRMLSLLGSLETEAARVTQARVISLVEPAAILLIGAVIALIMVAVMMAITGLSTTVG
jgi:general secretion pathway protein F